jgi:putative ABC transport system permease protein
MAAAVRSQLVGLDKRQPVHDVMRLDELRAISLTPRRINMMLLGAFALLALALGSIGIFGVVSYSASRRRNEIGIRMALGARPRDVRRLIVGQTLVLVLAGEVLGLGGALALNRVMSSLLYGVTATDPLTYCAGVMTWTMVALLACYVPARRGTRVDPMTALRCE